jgi:hypothetical protein
MMKKAILTLVCVIAALLLCSCQIHIDTDPWPASPDYTEPTVTPLPGDTPFATTEAAPATAEPLPAEGTTLLQPVVTQEPQPQEQEAVEPGING